MSRKGGRMAVEGRGERRGVASPRFQIGADWGSFFNSQAKERACSGCPVWIPRAAVAGQRWSPPWSPLSWNPRSCCRQGSQRTLAWAAVLSVVIPFLTAVSALFVDFHPVFLASTDVSTDASALHARGASERKNHQTVIFWSAAKGGAALDDAGPLPASAGSAPRHPISTRPDRLHPKFQPLVLKSQPTTAPGP